MEGNATAPSGEVGRWSRKGSAVKDVLESELTRGQLGLQVAEDHISRENTAQGFPQAGPWVRWQESRGTGSCPLW